MDDKWGHIPKPLTSPAYTEMPLINPAGTVERGSPLESSLSESQIAAPSTATSATGPATEATAGTATQADADVPFRWTEPEIEVLHRGSREKWDMAKLRRRHPGRTEIGIMQKRKEINRAHRDRKVSYHWTQRELDLIEEAVQRGLDAWKITGLSHGRTYDGVRKKVKEFENKGKQ